MSELSVNNQNELLAFIKENLTNDKNLSIRGLARLCGLYDNKTLISGGDFKSEKLGQKLMEHGFTAEDLVKNGFDVKACWLVIEYFAYESKAKAPGAKQIARTFGQIGLMTTFDKLTEVLVAPVRQLSVHTSVEYANAAQYISQENNKTLQELLRNQLIDELSVIQSQTKALSPSITERTIVKVRAKELGYTITQIGNGTALGKWVAKSIPVSFEERVGKYIVKHYEVTTELDEVIHDFFSLK
jgi:hypothetical protein